MNSEKPLNFDRNAAYAFSLAERDVVGTIALIQTKKLSATFEEIEGDVGYIKPGVLRTLLNDLCENGILNFSKGGYTVRRLDEATSEDCVF
jgi:hypothetical protein